MQERRGKYIRRLNQFSTSQLEEFLRMDLESSEGCDTDVIFQILEVIEQRETDSSAKTIPDTEQAWVEFQQYYNIPEGRGISLYPCRQTDCSHDGSKSSSASKRFNPNRWLRRGAVAVAAIMVFFGGLVAVQASGIDVFGTIGRWTNDTFHFVSLQGNTLTQEDLTNLEYCQVIKDALGVCGITGDLAPTWYPPGFELTKMEISTNRTRNTVGASFDNLDGRCFNIAITRHQSITDADIPSYEKDSMLVEEYVSKSKTFYLMTNTDTTTATWSNGFLLEKISGDLSTDNIKAIIDSIGGA